MDIKKQIKQKGFLLVEAMVALGVLGTVAALTTQQYVKSKQEDSAKYVGEQAAIYNTAIRSYLADNATTIVNGTSFSGVNWLRSAAICPGLGTGTVNYLPCSFSSILPFNMSYNTVFTKNGDSLTADTNLGRIVVNGGVRTDLSEEAKLSAFSKGKSLVAKPQAASPITGSTFVDYNVTYSTGANEGNFHTIASNSNSKDSWLRTDGSNKMTGNLDANFYSIDNVYNIRSFGMVDRLDERGSISTGGRIRSYSWVSGQGDYNYHLSTVQSGGAPGGSYGTAGVSGRYVGKLAGDASGALWMDAEMRMGKVYINNMSQGAIITRTGNGTRRNYGDNYALLGLDNNGGASNTPGTAAGSVSVNDILVRSKQMWLSDYVVNNDKIKVVNNDITSTNNQLAALNSTLNTAVTNLTNSNNSLTAVNNAITAKINAKSALATAAWYNSYAASTSAAAAAANAASAAAAAAPGASTPGTVAYSNAVAAANAATAANNTASTAAFWAANANASANAAVSNAITLSAAAGIPYP